MPMNLRYMSDHRAVLEDDSDLNEIHRYVIRSVAEASATTTFFSDQWKTLYRAASMIEESLRRGGKLMLCGNGGSFADCQHLEAEFIGRMKSVRQPLPAICLGSSGASVTCISNDFTFDDVFARQLDGLGSVDDCLMVFSTSGNSKNIINVLQTAQRKCIQSIGLLGGDGGLSINLCNFSILVPGTSTERIQEGHMFAAHLICGMVEHLLEVNHIGSRASV